MHYIAIALLLVAASSQPQVKTLMGCDIPPPTVKAVR